MTTPIATPAVSRYARCIATSRRINWDIDRDVIRGRSFDPGRRFLPDSLSLVGQLPFLPADDQRFFSQVQGRTYANMFGLVERFIGAKIVEVTRDHAVGDQVAMEALVGFAGEELKHQELFRRLEVLAADVLPPGYRFLPEANAVAEVVLGRSTWSVLALTCDIELFTQAHYRASIERDAGVCPLWKDVFFFHWREEAQHAILDELEWRRIDAALGTAERDRGVTDLIALIGAVDGLLQLQAGADAAYFAAHCDTGLTPAERHRVEQGFLAAYRWQYIHSGAGNPRFGELLGELLLPGQLTRIASALAALQPPAQAAA